MLEHASIPKALERGHSVVARSLTSSQGRARIGIDRFIGNVESRQVLVRNVETLNRHEQIVGVMRRRVTAAAVFALEDLLPTLGQPVELVRIGRRLEVKLVAVEEKAHGFRIRRSRDGQVQLVKDALARGEPIGFGFQLLRFD